MNLHRLPELFCGFERRKAEGPTLYPVACNPQAWACGSVFMLMESILGVEINSVDQIICFKKPILPNYLSKVRIRNLQVGNARCDIEIESDKNDVRVNLKTIVGRVKLVLEK